MKKILIFFSVPFLVICLSTSVFASVMQWTGTGANNNWYEVVYTDKISFTNARIAAQNRYNGGGELASVTSDLENTFVTSLLSNMFDSYGPWIGGFKVGTDWTWLDGETWDPTYDNWASGQPSGNGPYIHYLTDATTGDARGWNDHTDSGVASSSVKGYIVEWKNNPVPEPATLFLFGLGLLGLTGANRKKM